MAKPHFPLFVGSDFLGEKAFPFGIGAECGQRSRSFFEEFLLCWSFWNEVLQIGFEVPAARRLS